MISVKPEIQKLLSDMGFISTVAGLYQKEIDDQTTSYVDFRKVDGRRFAKKKNGEFVDDEDTIEILKQFKEEREKLESQSSEDDKNKQPSENKDDGMGKATHHLNTAIVSPEVKNLPSPTFDYIKSIVGDDLLEVFGDTGTGKSKFVHTLAVEALNAGKKVYYLDTERNLNKSDVEVLGQNYKYTPLFKEIKEIVLGKLPKCDLVIIDSVGLPILTRFATLNMKERGNALLDLISVVGRLKEWAYENSALAVITNQPESEFNKSADEVRKPFGDKACFAAKEIWLTRQLKSTKSTNCLVESFRSRSMKRGLTILQLDISDEGTKIMMYDRTADKFSAR